MKRMPVILVVLFDLGAVAVAWGAAFLLRYNFDVTSSVWPTVLASLWWALVVYGIAFRYFGLYRGMWRFASLPDLRRILIAVGAAAVLLPVVLFMIQRLVAVPRSVLLLHPLLLVMIMGGARFAYRSWKDGHLVSLGELGSEPLIVLGAGTAGAALLRALAGTGEWRIVGLLDDDAGKIGRHLRGVPVLGTVAEVGKFAEAHAVKNVVIAMPKAPAHARRRAAELAVAAGLKVMTVPAVDDLLSGKVKVEEIRRVELEDLLGRDRIEIDLPALRALLSGKVILVTGAGGSIGAELCRQIAGLSPARLICLESSEFALYRLEQQLSTRLPESAVSYVIGDVRDCERMAAVFAAYAPAVVFHAAAYKHVPLMEGGNAAEAVRNNVLGSYNVAMLAQRFGVDKFVLVSTDKAVNPTNVMGATKRLAERMVQQLQAADGTRFITVRFGNVLGSNGSVIPKFREQIARGGPVTVTHPEISRYFMLIPEAAQLVMQAGLMGKGGEIFVLDMGEPVKIVDLARDMIRLSGFGDGDIRIEFTGLRPGEKLFEELLADGELTLPTPHPKLRIARAREAHDDTWLADVRAWIDAGETEPSAVKAGLKQFVPEYMPEYQR